MAKGYDKSSLAKARAARRHRQTIDVLNSEASDCDYVGGVDHDMKSLNTMTISTSRGSG